jgi:aminomethyltransferase
MDATLSDMEMLVTRTGYTGEVGYEIYLRNAYRDGVKLWNTMLEAGKPYNISPAGPSLIRRLEHV